MIEMASRLVALAARGGSTMEDDLKAACSVDGDTPQSSGSSCCRALQGIDPRRKCLEEDQIRQPWKFRWPAALTKWGSNEASILEATQAA